MRDLNLEGLIGCGIHESTLRAVWTAHLDVRAIPEGNVPPSRSSETVLVPAAPTVPCPGVAWFDCDLSDLGLNEAA